MVDKTNSRAYTTYTMKLILSLLAITLCSGCSTVDIVFKDPRCQYRQYCPYTDPPPAIRTEPIRTSIDPAVR